MFLWFLLRDERLGVDQGWQSGLLTATGREEARPSRRSRSSAGKFSHVPKVEDWPGHDRRYPRLSSPTWAVRAPLAAWLQEQARQPATGYRVLDVGCGPKPYYPFFAERASEYVGVDVVEHPAAELVGPRRGAARRRRRVRPRPLHAGARALRRPGAGGAGAAARDRPRRTRARVDARRAVVSPLAGGLLALDARRADDGSSTTHAEWSSVDGRAGRRHRGLSRDARSAPTRSSRSAASALRRSRAAPSGC